ncbi:MAG: transglycosylase family protein [Acidimicrobiia bacterium]|nr:transglycosylase family protein [Acidimicrobiia bacterium]
MRRIAYLIAAGITLSALSLAGFALFSPVPVDAPVDPVSLSLPEGRGLAAGRLASVSFTAVASQAMHVQVLAGPETFEALLSASLSPDELRTGPRPTTTTAPPTTTTSAPKPTTTTSSPPTTTSTTTPPTTTSTSLPPTTTTTAPTTTTTVPSSGPLTESQMRDLAVRFFPAEEVEKAVLVAKCESGFNPNAYNPAGPYGGLFQHLESAWAARATAAGYPGASIFDPEANTAAAHLVWSSSGWGPWPSCSSWADGQLGG